ncbi:MAG TPA: hypothetical protein VF159_03990 [Gemmatimonadaceae bacterium]
MHGQFRPPDHSKGDERTIGGYAAVHDRPAAFEGPDGFSYSVEMMTEETGETGQPWGAYFLFVKWARVGAQTPEGHVESDYLVRAHSADEALRRLGETSLEDVKGTLDALVSERQGERVPRRWWDVMRDERDDVP